MYDTVEVHRKLPWAVVEGIKAKDIRDLKQGANWKEVEFQTKSIENCMNHYKIAVNGKLYIQRANYTEVKKSRKVAHADFPMMKIDGKPWFEPAPQVPTSLVFYATTTLEPYDYWIEFEAIFLQGKLHEIKLNALEKTNSDFDESQNAFQTKRNFPLRDFFKKFIKWQEKLLLGSKW